MRIDLRRLNLLAFSALMALGLSACARHGIITVETSNSEARGVVIGEVNPVREGSLEMLRLADVSSGVIDWGIGYGTTEGAGAPLGETMFLDGQAVSGTSPAAGNPRFLGPFAVGIAPDQKPAARYRSAPRMKSTSVADLLSDLAMTFEQPVLVVGTVHFDRLGTGTGLDNQSTARTLRNTEALFVAVVARHEDTLNSARRRMFHIPEGMGGLVDDLMLSSAAVLSKPPKNWRVGGEELRANVREIVPVDPASSRISVGEVDVYVIDSITQP